MTADAFFEMLKARKGNWHVTQHYGVRDGTACPLTCFFNRSADSYVEAARLLGIPRMLRDDITSASDWSWKSKSKTVRALRRRLLRVLKLKETET